MAEKKVTEEIDFYRTKDGSMIREIFHPNNSGVTRQSLAEARMPPGAETEGHYHRTSEEIYYILQGKSVIRLGKDTMDLTEGEAILIPPGIFHNIKNIGETDLIFLCMCSPPYSHNDTELV